MLSVGGSRGLLGGSGGPWGSRVPGGVRGCRGVSGGPGAAAGTGVSVRHLRLFQLRDFLLVYNRMTELCFRHCVSNLNYRLLTGSEVRPGVPDPLVWGGPGCPWPR